MASGYTVFISYMLESISVYSKFIHCNYFKTLTLSTNNPYVEEISFGFSDPNDFKFLCTNVTNGTGYTAHKIYGLVQLVANSGFTYSSDIKPTASKWKLYDVTTQITGHISGTLLTASQLTAQAFKIPLKNYSLFPVYNLHDFINYPLKGTLGDGKLCFGDETYFLGNVQTDIKATAYTTDIPIDLPAGEFNSSTNLTWDGDTVAITEVGIYDTNKNLVAIGKFNNPIPKDSTISRTIVFQIDF